MSRVFCVLPGIDGICDYDAPSWARIAYEEELETLGLVPSHDENENEELPF